MKNLISNKITKISLHLRDAMGRESVEQISQWDFTAGSDATSNLIALQGEYLAPSHIHIFQNGYKAFLEVLATGYPVVLNGSMLGHGEQAELYERNALKIGDVQAHIRLIKNRTGSRIQWLFYWLFAISAGVGIATGIDNTCDHIRNFQFFLGKAKISPVYEARVDNLKKAKETIEANLFANWFVSKSDYEQTVVKTLSDQYFISDIESIKTRKKILDRAKMLDVPCPDLELLYQTEFWAQKCVATNAIDTLPLLKPNANSAVFQYCTEVVDLIDQAHKLRCAGELSLAKSLILESPILKNKSEYTPFFKPLLLSLIKKPKPEQRKRAVKIHQ